MDCHKPHQPYAIPMVCYNFTSHAASINSYTHIHNSLACRVQGLYNAANTIAHSNCLAFTYNSLHRAKRTHRGPNFQKRCCCWQFSLKYRHIFKNGQQRKVSVKRPLKIGQKKAKRPTQKSYDEPAWNTAKFPKFGRKTTDLVTLLPSAWAATASLICPCIEGV